MADRAALVAAGDEVGRVGREHADASAAGRRLAPPVVEALEASGIFALQVPTALGGRAADGRTALDVVTAIARHDASTAWCASIGLGSNHLAGILPEAAARQVFTQPHRGGAGPFAPGGPALPVGDAVRVAGRWPYASNCQQAAMAAVGVVVTEGGSPKVGPHGVELGLAFLTDDQFTVEETWDTDGLQATGSHDITADAELPPELVSSLWADKWPDDPIFRLRTFDVLAPSLAGVPLGIGRAALDLVEARAEADAAAPPRPGPRPRLADNPWSQADLGKAEVRLRASAALLHEVLDEAHEHAVRGDRAPRAVSATIGLACSEALAAGRQAVDTAIALLGTDAVRSGCPLLRLRRDIDAAGSHIMFSPTICAGLARELAGIPTAAFPFLPPPD